MEEHHSVNVTSVLSDASPHSSLSLESYEYYQTEIFDQLPSIQACRPGRSRQGVLGVCEAERGSLQPGEKLSDGYPWTRAPRDKASLQPLRNLAMCIEAKRGARVRRQMQISNIGYWESWRRSQSIYRKRVWAQVRGSLSGMLPWKRTLRVIEGRFGVGVKAYFVFLRYLIYLNLLHCALVWGYILGPTTFYGRGNSSKPWRFGSKDSFLQFFNGSSYLNQSPVFYGFYTRGSLNFPCLHTPLLYFAGILTILFLSLAMVVRRMTVGLKHTWLLGKRYSMNVSYKIFRGWDFTIQDPAAGTLKQSFIRNDLKLFLEEQSFSQREAKRTLGQRVRLYLLRFIFNVLVVSLLGGAFYLIFFATNKSLKESAHGWFVSLFFQYLAPITITFVNLLLPHIFRKISSFEDYSYTTQVNTTIVRSIFLKLASLGIYLYFLFKTTKVLEQHRCKENLFGREICKLSIFNFLAMFFKTFLLEFPRKLVQEKYPTSLLARRLGTQSFLITFNVLDLVYSQTVSWVGIYYCPLLPLIGIVTLVATFYIKKFTVLRCCVAEQRMFRATSSSVLFHFMLLLGLLMAAAALGFSLFQEEVTVDNMSSCGPFGNGETLYNVTGVCVDSLPSPAQSVLRYMASEAFAVPLILTEIIILTSYVSRGRVNQRAIMRLEDMLVTSSSDKRFLVRQHTTMLRLQRELRRLRSASFREDAAPSVAGKTSPPSPPPDTEAD